MTGLERQHQFLSFFDRQIKLDRVSHAYMLIGKNDTYEVALAMAKRIFCPQGGEDNCVICQRIDHNEYADLHIISGKETSIKKDEILDLKEVMAQTAFESNSKKIYIIHDVDQASPSALNSLLKFLEEPESDITAILTTQNVNKVLETVQSRCLLVHLKPLLRRSLVSAIQDAGFPKRESIYLSYIAENKDEALKIGESTQFIQLLDLMEQLSLHYEKREMEVAGILLQVACKEKKMDLKSINWLCLMHIAYYNEFKHKDVKFLPVLKASLAIQDRIQPGVISSMLMDQFAYELIREDNL
ncbi:hypothetical protein AOC36_11435 [Erysipelothrix larvae]|uniref:DNA polymerase III subunit delta n=1 Tax=Erysipelothrix larvae TaxID=1514105 RepID=A0A109UHQ4_9FIRM|nr:hypothetical protein [Erysipelothrix larvae]AMC94561.1 hypothetical protein AOC36_11435 [Erysipelothrix larvae]